MAYATETDVQSRLGRPLTTEENEQVSTLLGDVEILIKSKIPDLEDQIEALTISPEVVVMVEASAVARLMRNPDGYTSESDGDYTYQINWKMASGSLEISEREWSLLGVSGGAFVINPKVRTPFESAALSLDPSSIEYAVWSMNADMFWYPR